MDNRQRAEIEISEFSERFPETDLDTVPQEVWDSVKTGVALADAYADHTEKKHAYEEAARRRNEENAAFSSANDAVSPSESMDSRIAANC